MSTSTGATVTGPPADATRADATHVRASEGTTFLAVYFVIGIMLGVVALKTELVSWFRIQEMFRFQAFHMYGILGSAVVVAAASIALLKRLGISTLEGEKIRTQVKVMGKGTRYWAGGILFGAGWALTGACPGPMFVLMGSGLGVFSVAFVSALVGMWSYGHLRPRLPH